MSQSVWFAADVPLDELQAAFAGELRQRASAWTWQNSNDTELLLPGDERYGRRHFPESARGRLLAAVDLVDHEARVVLVTLGAYLDGERLFADRLHNQNYTLPDVPTAWALDVSGEPAVLGLRAADWFEETLRRPVDYQEWLRQGEVYAHRWVFADTGEVLAESRTRAHGLGGPDRRRRLR